MTEDQPPLWGDETPRPAPLPPGYYADGTDGQQGTTSLAAEPTRRQKRERLIAMVVGAGPRGRTSLEVERITRLGHGAVSGALSIGHSQGRLTRLTEVRDGYGVYVGVQFINDRPHHRPKSSKGATE